MKELNGVQGLKSAGAAQLFIILVAESLKVTRAVEVPTEVQPETDWESTAYQVLPVPYKATAAIPGGHS